MYVYRGVSNKGFTLDSQHYSKCVAVVCKSFIRWSVKKKTKTKKYTKTNKNKQKQKNSKIKNKQTKQNKTNKQNLNHACIHKTLLWTIYAFCYNSNVLAITKVFPYF